MATFGDDFNETNYELTCHTRYVGEKQPENCSGALNQVTQ